jgi:hypothetical protein
MRHLANDAEPEFSEIRVLRGLADVDANMPRFLRIYLAAVWSQAVATRKSPA